MIASTVFAKMGSYVIGLYQQDAIGEKQNEYVANMTADFAVARDTDIQTAVILDDVARKNAVLDSIEKNKQFTQYGTLAAIGVVAVIALLSMKRR